jgi:23S rRNA-intervening sequence protein
LEKDLNGTGIENFAQFVSLAKGSVGEIRAQLIYALDFGYLNPGAYSDLDQLGKTPLHAWVD